MVSEGNLQAQVFPLTSDGPGLKSNVNTIGTTQLTGTNVCLGLDKADTIIFGAGHHTAANTHRYVVLLSDGDNVYNWDTYQESPPSPSAACTPKFNPGDDGFFATARWKRRGRPECWL